jgi:glutaredoxin
MNKVIVFSLKGCGHCTSLKKFLNEKLVSFIDIEINENREIWSQVIEQTNENLVPTVFIQTQGIEDGPVFVAGRDFNSPEELYEKIKLYVLE